LTKLVTEILRKHFLSEKPNSSAFNLKKVREETKAVIEKIESDGNIRYILNMVESN